MSPPWSRTRPRASAASTSWSPTPGSPTSGPWRRSATSSGTGSSPSTSPGPCTASARPPRRWTRGGAIVATGSTNAWWVEAGAAAYNASKGAIVPLVKTAALELGPRGIRVNVVHPGIVDTRISSFVVHDPEHAAPLLEKIPLGRFAEPEDIAKVIAFLVGDDAAYVSGAELTADGGMTAGTPFPEPGE